MFERKTFRLFKRGMEVRLEVIAELHWKVVAASPDTGFRAGDEVSPPRATSWRSAKRRVNSARSSLSPQRLVLLRGNGFEKSDGEVEESLRTRPWDPDFPPAA